MMKRVFSIFSIITAMATLFIVLWFNLFTVNELRDVGNFKHLYVNGPIKVFLVKGLGTTIRIEADKGLPPKIVTEVVNGELKIYPNSPIRHERVLKVYVSSLMLSKVSLFGPSTLEVTEKITSDTLWLQMNQSAEARILADVKAMKVELNEVSNLFIAGKADYFQLDLTGFSDIVAYNFQSKQASVNVEAPDQSEGILRIAVSDTLRVRMAPPLSRKLYYKGNPQVVASNEIRSMLVKK